MTDTMPAPVADGGETGQRRPSGPRIPLIPGPLETLGILWRRLRRMSTALMFLFALAVATLIATFIPQEPVIASTVRLWRTGEAGPGAAVASVMDSLSLFDVFGSWWFGIFTVLLFVSLTGCLIPRWRVFLRNVRRPPSRGGNFDRLGHRVVLDRPAGLADEDVLTTAERMFRNYRTRRTVGRDGQAQLAIERGHWREFGSLIFHTSFYLLLIGVTLGAAFSFTGQIDFAEGEGFSDTPVGYDTQTAGRLWDSGNHTGAITRLDDFEVTYLPDGFTPDEFVSTVTFTDPDGTATTEEIRVNHPAFHDGLTYYQRGFGFAPTVTLRSGLDGAALYEETIVLRTDAAGFWTGRGKVSVGNRDPNNPLPQIGIEVLFLPDAEFGDDGTVVFNSPEAKDPRMLVTIYLGEDLGLDQTLPLSRLNWTEDDIVDRAMIVPGQSVGMAAVGGGAALFEVEFSDLAMWSGLQVSHQPYRWLLLTAASMTLMGLIPSLYAYRRRLWVQVEDEQIVLAGVAQHRKQQFDEVFDDLSQRFADRLGAAPIPPVRSIP